MLSMCTNDVKQFSSRFSIFKYLESLDQTLLRKKSKGAIQESLQFGLVKQGKQVKRLKVGGGQH